MADDKSVTEQVYKRAAEMAPIEQLLVNLKLLGIRNDDLSRLPDYVEMVAQATGVPMPVNTCCRLPTMPAD